MALLTRLCFLSHPCVKISQNFNPKPLLLFQPAANMSSTILTQVLASSVAIAGKAGEIVRDIMKKGDLGILEKTGKDDLQTQADRSAQNCIIASLAKQFPQLKVVGEEGEQDLSDVPADWIVTAADKEAAAKVSCPDKYKNVAMEDLTVWVDPLDGTKEYTQVS
jgi:3'(2'), 5'-bisphosphate nucleotidase